MTSYSRVHRSRSFSPMEQSISGSLSLAAARYPLPPRSARESETRWRFGLGGAENPGAANGPTRPVH